MDSRTLHLTQAAILQRGSSIAFLAQDQQAKGTSPATRPVTRAARTDGRQDKINSQAIEIKELRRKLQDQTPPNRRRTRRRTPSATKVAPASVSPKAIRAIVDSTVKATTKLTKTAIENAFASRKRKSPAALPLSTPTTLTLTAPTKKNEPTCTTDCKRLPCNWRRMPPQ